MFACVPRGFGSICASPFTNLWTQKTNELSAAQRGSPNIQVGAGAVVETNAWVICIVLPSLHKSNAQTNPAGFDLGFIQNMSSHHNKYVSCVPKG